MSDGGHTPEGRRYGVVGPRLQIAKRALAASGELAVQLVAARHVHAQLAADDIRDVKLVVLLMEVESGQLSGKLSLPGVFPYSSDAVNRVAAIGGVSRARVSTAITRLLEAGALIIQEGTDPHLLFVERVQQPVGAAEHVDWPSVLAHIRGHAPAILVLRGLLDHLYMPWEWTSVTYQDLAERCCYSLGMVRHGTEQLLKAGVLERRVHAGRGHGYRCSAWALGRDSTTAGLKPQPADVAKVVSTSIAPAVGLLDAESHSLPAPTVPESTLGEATVEIGNVVVRVPAGTVIRMQVTSDGGTIYHVGPHLRLTHRPAP